MTKLKRCPFCGGKATQVQTSIPNFPFVVACDGCSVRTGAFSDKDTAIEEWNRRACPWINGSDRLPDEPNVPYIIMRENNIGGFDCQISIGNQWGEPIKYWMPIPLVEVEK